MSRKMKTFFAMLFCCVLVQGEELVTRVLPESVDGTGGESTVVRYADGKLSLRVWRKMKMAAEAGNFQVQALDAGGKELLRAKGAGELERQRELFACFMEFPLAEWKGDLTVKVAERGVKGFQTYIVKRITQEEADRLVNEAAAEGGEVDPFAKENTAEDAGLDPVPLGKERGKFRAGGKVLEVLPEGLLMPGKVSPWLLKGYPDAETVKAGAEVRCVAGKSRERFSYRDKDGTVRKLWVYGFLEFPR